tara:strand:- start:295 stop:1347 length:1053 start_codon:yes stop_codon:yes gene_type:complete
VKEFYLDEDIKLICDLMPKSNLKYFEGKKIILTGAYGFLGRYFLKIFSYLNQNHLQNKLQVFGIDNSITGNSNLLNLDEENINFFNNDATDKFEVDSDIDIIIHAAGIASPFYYKAYPLETLDVAITGTRNFLELSKEKKSKFIFFSSSEIYGDPDINNIPIKESYNGNLPSMGSRSCYDEGKRVGETLTYIYNRKFNIHTNVIRPFNVFGPGMQETDYRVLPNFAKLIRENKPLKVYGNGNQTRTFTYIVDAMIGFLSTIANGITGEAYNIGTPNPELSILDLVKNIEQAINKKLDINITKHPDSYPSDEPKRRCPDITKASIQLDFKPQMDLKESLKKYIDWSINFHS